MSIPERSPDLSKRVWGRTPERSAYQYSDAEDVITDKEAWAVFRYGVKNAPSHLGSVGKNCFAFLWYVFDGDDPRTQRTFRYLREVITIYDEFGHERELTEEEIERIKISAGTFTGGPVCSIEEAIEIVREETTKREVVSIDMSVGESRDTMLGEFIPDPSQNTEEKAERTALNGDLMNTLLLLEEREREILIMRFGLNGSPGKTLEEVGRKFGLTRERIRQIQEKALKKLRILAANDLKDYLKA